MTENTKELLECVAEVVGITSYRYVLGFEHLGLCISDAGAPLKVWWNPIDDDGDAFRLMVFLANKYEDFHSIVWSWTHRDIRVFAGGHEGFGEDECARLRYAIVRAAAEIGRKLK